MATYDLFRFAASSVLAHRLRSILTMLGIVIGIASVTLLTSVGQGTHEYILSEFTQFGTRILGVHPGKATTAAAPTAASRDAPGAPCASKAYGRERRSIAFSASWIATCIIA